MLKSGSFDENSKNEDLFSSGTCSPDEDFIEPQGVIQQKINKKIKEEVSETNNNYYKIKIKMGP